MIKLNQSLHRLQVAWREAQQSSSPSADNLREQFERLMTIYLSTKTAMTEPQMLQNCLHLQVSMAILLVQLAIGNQGTELVDLTFPLSEVEKNALAYVPGDQQGVSPSEMLGLSLWPILASQDFEHLFSSSSFLKVKSTLAVLV